MKGAFLKRKRQETKLSAKDVARITGVPYTSYLTAEKGTNCPSVVHAIRIARFFKISVEILFSDFMEVQNENI